MTEVAKQNNPVNPQLEPFKTPPALRVISVEIGNLIAPDPDGNAIFDESTVKKLHDIGLSIDACCEKLVESGNAIRADKSRTVARRNMDVQGVAGVYVPDIAEGIATALEIIDTAIASSQGARSAGVQ